MDIDLNVMQEGEHCRLKLNGDLVINDVAELKGQLLGYLNQFQHLEINLADVESVDSAGIQLLYLLKREAREADKNLSLVSHSPATLEALELLNMEAYFGDPVILAS
jgi:anti-anti-sigma factor